MESGVTKEFTHIVAESTEAQNPGNTDSTDTFQSFIYELFEKNGILNDLRAYLRGHIVNVLKSAQTGDPPACQKNFTQRLELAYQALNILIAEYLLRLEFSYSFSVFVSEIPLANMVFGFAKNLLKRTDENNLDIRFKDNDVWSILNYLGMQCDSEHASNIVEMYRNEEQNPLLLCILKCLPVYKLATGIDQVITSEESLSSAKSIESMESRSIKKSSLPDRCRHYEYCKTCQNRTFRLKEKYKQKKKGVEKMFQQLKSVYETEVEMVKVEEEKKVKRSMATHALQLQKRRDEMEENFKAREAELERSVQQKKRFLWGLARSLRDQHEHMTRAMRDVRQETQRLSLKEHSLKAQLAEAEEILRKRGEEMRQQISNELVILEGHLESMKKERDNITRERAELENMKAIEEDPEKAIKVHKMDSDHVDSHYDLLRNELAILKKYLESTKITPKCVIERATGTEPSEVSPVAFPLNNCQAAEKPSKSDDMDDRVKANQVVNDFKKKNVNFSQSHLDELYHERSRDRSRSSGSSEAGDNVPADLDLDRNRDRDLIQRLRDENDRLRAFALQHHPTLAQRSEVSQNSSRPCTAPPVPVPPPLLYPATTASASTVNVGWRKGAGEELSVFSNAQPRIMVPGDTLPFIGVLRDRHGTARRPLVTQCRLDRTRAWPLTGGVTKRGTSPHRDRLSLGPGTTSIMLTPNSRYPVASCSLQPEDTAYHSIRERINQKTRPALSLEINRNREKSPKTVLREAKENLRNKDLAQREEPPASRDKSPNSVLREAKLRLRKLEIEAEAVEKSYLDFRRRQSELRLERIRTHSRINEDIAIKEPVRNIEVKRSKSLEKLEEPTRDEIAAQYEDLHKSMRRDFDKYLREYENKFDIGELRFRNKTTVAEKIKPIPMAFSNVDKEPERVEIRDNYLETPLTEFRKLYTCARQAHRDDSETKSNPKSMSGNTSISSVKNDFEYEPSLRHDALRKAKHDKQAQLEILKQNINKMYNLPSNAEPEIDDPTNDCTSVRNENILRVEVESISEINDIKSQAQEILLVVQSSVDARQVHLAATGTPSPGESPSAPMTIIVSPKRSQPDDENVSLKSDRPKRSLSPEQEANLTKNNVLDAIFHADPNNQISSVQMQLELSKEVLEDSISEYEKGEEYPYDFSADVDNYNSRSEFENSPISLPNASENDNFWDS
ncbi:uncharacterized protein LOC113499884 isoform X2 [Trichoplusia ni]|uniref:Uncharacterized protein LOC113499884 isoform X2 n=1 Tax=Trichoplusia ni TaxID=7111 RepID=A0A7E5W7R5_TRINI|nr:uncharacterized protein LOC113499884 isoform X2 [Trichoplusia ni]